MLGPLLPGLGTISLYPLISINTNVVLPSMNMTRTLTLDYPFLVVITLVAKVLHSPKPWIFLLIVT